jgi:serine/threonine protein kinase
MAPEIMTGGAISYAIDWWAVGVMVYEFAFGKVPFCVENGDQEKLSGLVLSAEPDFPPGTDPNLCAFICELLKKDPEKRLGSNGADPANHPYLSGSSQ